MLSEIIQLAEIFCTYLRLTICLVVQHVESFQVWLCKLRPLMDFLPERAFKLSHHLFEPVCIVYPMSF